MAFNNIKELYAHLVNGGYAINNKQGLIIKFNEKGNLVDKNGHYWNMYCPNINEWEPYEPEKPWYLYPENFPCIVVDKNGSAFNVIRYDRHNGGNFITDFGFCISVAGLKPITPDMVKPIKGIV